MLTKAQQDAVRRVGQGVCVVAGPGSGKTRVLIERFAWLVEECGVDPTRILAITFTEKAATEIKERLIDRFASRADLRQSIERAWVSTIHGFCARLLRENAIAAGLAPDFAVLDQAPADRLAREAAEEALDALYTERPDELRRLLEALDLSTQDDGPQPDLARSLLAVYEAMRLSGLQELPASEPSAEVYESARALARSALADLTRGNTPNQKNTHGELRRWAEQFLALPPEPITLEHFRALKLGVNLGHLVKGSRSRIAADELKNEILPRLEMYFLERWNAGLLDLLRTAVSCIDTLYRQKKRSSAALDFSDLEEDAIRLLESDHAVREETAGRFDQILMDELQDTNRLQWRLINLIRRGFFAVGDVNQSIYGFRHAEPAVFDEYRRELEAAGATIDDLRENHRSRAEILDAVSRMLNSQPGIEPRPLIAVREFDPQQGPFVERLVGRGEQASEVEAALVAARVRELTDGRACDFRHIAILVRTLNATEPFERALDRFGIPFIVSGGRSFLEAREIRDLLALLAALVNPLDDIALVGVLRSPLVCMSDEEIFRLGPEGRREQFEKRFGRLRPLAGFVAPDRMLAAALDETGYAGHLPDRARANMEKLFAYVRREHRAHPHPLAEVLEDLEALRATQSEAEAPPADAGNLVRLMSIHAAKGLEFPVVFISALQRGPDRRRPVIGFSPVAGLGVKWRNPETGKGQSDPTHAIVVEEVKQKEEAEENRLLYVAMTRAENRLILSYAESKRPSPWQKLAEADVPVITAATQAPVPSSKPMAAPALVQEELVDPPLVTGQHDSSAGVTSIAQFHACPRKYFLGQVAVSKAIGRGPGSSQFGLEVHQALVNEGGSVEARELAARFTRSDLGRRASRAARIEREYDFLLHIDDLVLRGQIDLWFEDSGELILVDYKTDREEAPEQYELQLRLYALALERYAGRLPDRVVLCYLRSDRAVEVSLDPAAMDDARGAVQAFAQAQESLQFPLKVGQQCRRCPFFGNRCPAQLFAEVGFEYADRL